MNIGTVLGLLLIGLAAGILSSMVGIGGGIVVVPCLVFIFGLSQKMAQGTSLALMLPPIGIASVIVYSKGGNVRFDYAALMCITFIVGSYFGSMWVKNLNTFTVKKVFAVFMIIVAIKYLFFDKPKDATPKTETNTTVLNKDQP
jgi:uncharacterized membrane protein YfcA